MANRGKSKEFRVQVNSLAQWSKELEYEGLVCVEVYCSWFGQCQVIGPTISSIMLDVEGSQEKIKWLCINVAKIEEEQRILLMEEQKKKEEMATM